MVDLNIYLFTNFPLVVYFKFQLKRNIKEFRLSEETKISEIILNSCT